VSSESVQRAKRLVKIVVGFTALVLGVVMIVTPGPGVVVIGFGLALLAAEFVWARRLLNRLKAGSDRLKAEGSRLRDAILPSSPAQKS
jgi:uncharacterized protein (TIGR02611 family)